MNEKRTNGTLSTEASEALRRLRRCQDDIINQLTGEQPESTVTVPTRVLMGLIRCGEFNEQHGITHDDGTLWDTTCREAMAYVRETGLRDDMLVLHGPSDFVHPRDRAARDEREAKRLDGPQR